MSPNMRTETNQGSWLEWKDTSQTLVFLDWDDTLFPTTELFDIWGLPVVYDAWDHLSLSAEQEQLLDRWCSALHLYLKSVCSVADRCVILTNSTRDWVSNCVDRFAPRLKPMFSRHGGLHVVYARECLANRKRGSRILNGLPRGTPAKTVDSQVLHEEKQETLTKAKLVAMQHEAKKFYSQYPGQTWKNILSVGDSKYEHDAAWELAFRRKAPSHECLRLKTVMTPVDPSIRDLTYRLGFETGLWRAYVNFDGDFDIDMNTPRQLHAIADILCMPELRTRIREFPVGEEDAGTLLEEFEEVAFVVSDRVARNISNELCSIPK
jgi:hypothetical protein